MSSDEYIKQLLEHLIVAYKAEPSAPIQLPDDPMLHRGLLDATKRAINAALDHDDKAGADRYVDWARAVARQTGTPEHDAWANWCAGLRLLNYEIRPALKHFDIARRYYQSTSQGELEGRVLIGYAGLLSQVGRLDEAAQAIERALRLLADVPDYWDWPLVYLNQAWIQGRQGDYEAMLQSAREAERRAANLNQPLHQARALINQAIATLFLGEVSQATDALNAAQGVAGTNAELTARIALNRARICIYQGDLWAAIRLLDEAQSNFVRAGITLDEATVRIEQAGLYQRLNLRHEAYNAASNAAKAFDVTELPAESVEARLFAIKLLLELDRPTKAGEELAVSKTQLDGVSPTLQALINGYAAHPVLQSTKVQRQQAFGQAEAAMATLQRIGAIHEWIEVGLIAAELAALIKQPDSRDRFTALAQAAGSRNFPPLEVRAQVGLAGQLSSGAALQPLQRATQLVIREWQQLPSEELKASVLTGSNEVMVQLIEAQLSARQPLEATQTLLLAKGGIWADLAMPAPSAKPDLAMIQLKTERSYWQDQRREALDPSDVKLCDEKIDGAEQALVERARRLARQRTALPLPEFAMVQASLPDKSVLVEFLVGRKDVHACVMAPNSPPRWVRLGRRDKLEQALKRTTLSIATGQFVGRNCPSAHLQAVEQELHALHQLLFEPFEHDLSSAEALIVVPDQFLYTVPWAALRGRRGYLGQAFLLLQIPSAVVCALPSPEIAWSNPLALAYPGFATSPQLLHVEAEVQQIQRAVVDTHPIYAASSSDLTWERPPRFLHFATHGKLNAMSPMLSYLEMADGPLWLADALQLSLTGTQFVTLSACETGSTPDRGGAVLALSGAFLCAGAACTLASLWRVDDEATQALMIALYQGVGKDLVLPEALRQAQQQLVQDGYTHPYYWAAFQSLQRLIVAG